MEARSSTADADRTPILIIGAGIAGCALGIALRRFGIPATVCEASAEPRDDIGGFVSVAPNGLRVLHAMNLAGPVHRIGFPTDRLDFHDRDGNFLAAVPAAGLTVLRGSLSRVLRVNAEKLGVRFEFGKALDAIRENESDVTAHSSDGTTQSSRVIVGADGVHSKTREIFFPHAPRASYAGILHFGGITRTNLQSTGNMMRMVFGHRAFFGYGVSPSGDTCWFSNCNQATAPSTDVAFRSLDNDVIREKLLALHRGDPPEVSRILRSSAGRIGVHAVYDLPTLPQWHSGRVCLVGDAAHAVGPHIGQGTSLALEDAFVLAKCLKNVPDPIDAFALFGALRRNRVESIFEHSRQLGRQRAPVGWLGGNLPDMILPKILHKKARDAATIYSYGLQWDKEPVPGLDFSTQTTPRFL